MTTLYFRHLIKSFIIFLAATSFSYADSKIINNYELTWSIFNSSFLTAEVASAYGFTRAHDKALLNISVLEGVTPPQKTIPAKITGTWYDLIHKKELVFKEIQEQDAVYYIAELPIDHRTTYYFEIKIVADNKTFNLDFNKMLYVEGK